MEIEEDAGVRGCRQHARQSKRGTYGCISASSLTLFERGGRAVLRRQMRDERDDKSHRGHR